MATKEYRQKQLAKARALGLCHICAKNPTDARLLSCASCRAYHKTQRRIYKERHPDRWKEHHARCEAKRPGRFSEMRRRYQVRVKDALFARYGERCVRCGFSDRRALQFDHIAGGGTQDRKRYAPSSNSYWRYVLDAPKGKFQVLCANCNSIKRHENKEFPKWQPQ